MPRSEVACPAAFRERVQRIASFYEEEQRRLAKDPPKAEKLASEPIGPVPEGEDVLELRSVDNCGKRATESG
jgi:hypothetical protein